MVRPIVLVFQEFATVTAVPTTPDLNCLIVGPAYQIQDYPADQASIEVSNYGTLNADNPYVPPVAFTPAITLAAPPNITAGAWVDPASIQVYFDEARVIMASGTDGVSTTTAPDENTLTSATATFVTDGIQAGDVLIVDNTIPSTGTLTFIGNPLGTETVIIDAKTYTFQTVLTDVDGNVLIGATASDSLDNLIAAITLGAGSGSTYAASMTLHPTVTGTAGSGDTMDAAAKAGGVAGDSIVTTTTVTGGSWGAGTLGGAAPTPNLALTVLSVDSETALRVSTNLSTGVTGLNYRIERELSDQLIDSSFINTPVFRVSNQIEILGGITLTVASVARVVAFARVYVEYRAFRTDLRTRDSIADTTEITTKIGRIDARNPLAAGVFLAKQNAGQAPIQFYGVETQDLVGYTKVRDAISTDDSVYAIVHMITDINVTSMFKTDNETLADPTLALSTGVPQKFRVVIGAGTLTLTNTISTEVTTGTTEQLSAATPPGIKTLTLASLTALTTNLAPGDLVTLSASENGAPLDGAYTLAHVNSETEIEVNEAFPIAVGAAEGINYVITRPSTGATLVPLVDGRATVTLEDVVYTSRVAGIDPGARTIAKVQDGTTASGIHSIVETAGLTTVINADWAGGAPAITAADVVAALNTGAGVTISFSGSVNLVASTAVGATVQTAVGATALSSGTPGTDELSSAATQDDAFIRLFDSTATFIADGVLAGDIIEIPEDPNGVYASNVKRFIVNTLISEQRLEVTNISSGSYTNNTATVENELPHLDNRLGAGTLISQGTIRYRVIRELNKDQQVADLVAVAQSLNSRRAILAWPDTVDVAGLVDGSLPPNGDGTAADAATQPGYYLGCVIGGMTAGLPSHQGFSRLGSAGVDQIFNSSDFFTERQLTDISDGGWYVFAQNTPTSLPFSIHQLTTDPSTLESGEYSIVKNFDFVSLFFLELLEPFLGIWNINNDTLGFIRQAINTGIDNLKLRRVSKIGAPINDAVVTFVEVSDASADRIEVFVEVDLPKPLNVIGLHLIG